MNIFLIISSGVYRKSLLYLFQNQCYITTLWTPLIFFFNPFSFRNQIFSIKSSLKFSCSPSLFLSLSLYSFAIKAHWNENLLLYTNTKISKQIIKLYKLIIFFFVRINNGKKSDQIWFYWKFGSPGTQKYISLGTQLHIFSC